MSEEEEIKIENIRRPVTFHKIYATNATGEWTEYDFRLEFFNEKMKIKGEGERAEEEEEEEWFYFSEAMVILAPKAVRRLKEVIDKAVKECDEDLEGESSE
jgi:hypothetical protein